MAKDKKLKETAQVETPKTEEKKEAVKKRSYKITKLSMMPSRKVNLGNYETIDMSAGIEVTFDIPVDVDSFSVKEAQIEMRKIVTEEMKEQFLALRPKKSAPTKPVKADN